MTEITKTVAQTMAFNVPNGEMLIQVSRDKLELARGITIDSQDMAGIAASECGALKAFHARMDGERKELVDPLNKVVKAINDKYREPLALLEEGERIIKKALLTWQNEQQRIAEAERCRLIEQARKDAAKLEAKADKMEAKGKEDTAEVLRAEAMTSVAVVQNLMTAPEKVAGISTRDNWKMICDDKLALVQFVAANPQYLDLLDFNGSAANKLAKALKNNLKISGCRIWNDVTIAARKAA